MPLAWGVVCVCVFCGIMSNEQKHSNKYLNYNLAKFSTHIIRRQMLADHNFQMLYIYCVSSKLQAKSSCSVDFLNSNSIRFITEGMNES